MCGEVDTQGDAFLVAFPAAHRHVRRDLTGGHSLSVQTP
jgi:hypothetical protein